MNTRVLGTLVLDAFRRLGGDGLDLWLLVDAAAVAQVTDDTRAADFSCRVHGGPPTGGVIKTLRCALDPVPVAEEVSVCLVTTVPISLPGAGEVQVDENLSTAEESGRGSISGLFGVKQYIDWMPCRQILPSTG